MIAMIVPNMSLVMRILLHPTMASRDVIHDKRAKHDRKHMPRNGQSSIVVNYLE